jgi:hypothetical protein
MLLSRASGGLQTGTPNGSQVLESPLEKKAGVNYGPPGSKRLVYFVDDLNMPRLDPYETAMPISLIRQHLGWGHWWGDDDGGLLPGFGNAVSVQQQSFAGAAGPKLGWANQDTRPPAGLTGQS